MNDMRKLLRSLFNFLFFLFKGKPTVSQPLSTSGGSLVSVTTSTGIVTFSGSYGTGITGSFPQIKHDVNILCYDKLSFDTHLALGEGINKEINNYRRIENPEDLINGDIIILGCFAMNPKVEEILRVLNKGLYYSGPRSSTFGLSSRSLICSGIPLVTTGTLNVSSPYQYKQNP